MYCKCYLVALAQDSWHHLQAARHSLSLYSERRRETLGTMWKGHHPGSNCHELQEQAMGLPSLALRGLAPTWVDPLIEQDEEHIEEPPLEDGEGFEDVGPRVLPEVCGALRVQK